MDQINESFRLPLQGQLIPIRTVPDEILRAVAADVLLLFALRRRTDKGDHPSPIYYADLRVSNILTDFANGGASWEVRQATIEAHIAKSSALSWAAAGLRLDDLCHFLYRGTTSCFRPTVVPIDRLDEIPEHFHRVIRKAMLVLLGLDHRPTLTCECDVCIRAVGGDWSAALAQRPGNELLIRELYVEAVRAGHPALPELGERAGRNRGPEVDSDTL